MTNTICEVVFETGKPFCTCAPGFVGDPDKKCGKYVPFQESFEFNTILPAIFSNVFHWIFSYLSQTFYCITQNTSTTACNDLTKEPGKWSSLLKDLCNLETSFNIF